MSELRSLFNDLVRVEILLWEAVDDRVHEELGVPLGRMQGLHAIATTPGCRVQDVADSLAITVGAASKLVDRIEAGGLCARRANPADRRSSLVEPTDAGRDVLARADGLIDSALAATLDGVGPTDLDRLRAILAALRARLTTSSDRTGQPSVE